MILSSDWEIQNRLVSPTEPSFVRVRTLSYQPSFDSSLLWSPGSDLREGLSVPLGSLSLILPSTPLLLRCHPECFLPGSSGRCLRQHYELMVSELVGAGCSEKESWQLRFRRDCEVQIPISLLLSRSLCVRRANLGDGFLAGLRSSSEGMWLTELSHDSDILPSITGRPMGLCEYFWAQGCFPLYPDGISQMVLLVESSLWRGYHCQTEWCLQGAEPVLGDRDFLLSSLVWLSLRTIVACSYTGVRQTLVNMVHTEGLWKILLMNPVSALGPQGSPLHSMENLWAFGRESFLLCWS